MRRKRLTEADEGEKMSPEAHVEERDDGRERKKTSGREEEKKKKERSLEGEKRILSRTPGCMQGLEIEWTPAGAPGAQKDAGRGLGPSVRISGIATPVYGTIH